MFGIRFDANDNTRIPTFFFSEFGIEVNLNPVTDLDILCHLFFAREEPEQHTAYNDCDRAVDRPLRVTGHIAVRQNVDALQKPDYAGNDQKNCNDLENVFYHHILIIMFV